MANRPGPANYAENQQQYIPRYGGYGQVNAPSPIQYAGQGQDIGPAQMGPDPRMLAALVAALRARYGK